MRSCRWRLAISETKFVFHFAPSSLPDGEPHLAASGFAPELAPAAVFVESEPTIVEKARECDALIARIGDDLVDRALRQDLHLFV